MYKGVQRNETGGRASAPRLCDKAPQTCWKKRNLFIPSPGGPAAESRPLGPKRDAGRAPEPSSSLGLCPTWPPLCAAASLHLPRVGPASPTLLPSQAPPPSQGPRGLSRGGSLLACLWDLLLKQEMQGWGSHCRTSARPLLCSETGSTAEEHGWGGVSASRCS